jgi:hypothetical protein
MFGFSVGLESGQILVVFIILLLSQFFIVVLKIQRIHWVIFVSAVVFGLALEMALQRWPWHTKKKEFVERELHINTAVKPTLFFKIVDAENMYMAW